MSTTMTVQCPSIAARLAMFEKKIEQNAERNKRDMIRLRPRPTGRRWQTKKGTNADCDESNDDNLSVLTAPTVSSYSTYSSFQNSNNPFDAPHHFHSAASATGDLVSLCELQPICCTKQQGNDSFNSSLSTVDFTSRVSHIIEEEDAHSVSSRSITSTVSMPCTTMSSTANVSLSSSRNKGDKNLLSLMSKLDMIDSKKHTKSKDKKKSKKPKSSRRPKVSK